MLTHAHCIRFVGQHVVFRTRDGVLHHGILHNVTPHGIYVRPIRGSTTRLASGTSHPDVHLLGELPAGRPDQTPGATGDVTEAWWPFFFFPFFALLALAPWAWWW
ncbi:hypothetical protein [Alicyclobacillus macrosporangiidus]|uniref:Uncharacterized protein n=1 Tax=Alicyclobacillus macrosporangiidus TaxID=392015 RepID=A0A1I7L559_9BACL|nr:hypothetical protein [Alicyclobacillus macrosporangiidus]SFV04775.1 hypothetical protein SAMN05421543_12514 [Alicyclobacillus macrosporangiidus]